MREAHPPARHPISLAESIRHEHFGAELRRTTKRTVVTEGVIDLVADDQDVALAAKLGETAQRLRRYDNARGIRRTVDDDRLSPRRHGRSDAIEVDVETRVRIDHDHPTTAERDQVWIAHEIWIEENYFVAGIDRTHQRQHKPAAGSAAYDCRSALAWIFGIDLALESFEIGRAHV